MLHVAGSVTRLSRVEAKLWDEHNWDPGSGTHELHLEERIKRELFLFFLLTHLML